MKNNLFGKVLVLMLMMVIVAAGATPVLSASMFDHNEVADVTSVEKNELLEVEEESSKIMTVTMVKLCQDGVIRSVREKISVKDYKEYVEKIKTSETLEETFAILKEYGIVPKVMTMDRFIQIMNEKMKKITLLQRLYNLFSKNIFSISMNPWELECYFTTYTLHLEPPVYNFYIPSIFAMLSTYSGGSVTACGESCTCPEGCLLEVMMLLYIGICTNPLAPFVDLDGVSCMGFAAYFYASCTC